MSESTIPKGKMIDIHMHLIPGVDDGAEDMEMATVMLLRAKDQGIRGVFATPHSSAFDNDAEGTKNKYRLLCSRAAQMFPDMKLYPGCEIYCETQQMPKVLAGLKSGKYPTMNGTKFVLTEFSMWVMPENTIPCVEALAGAGYTPIIAHMERYRYLRDNMALVEQYRKLGARIQLNVYSLFDEMDDSIKNWARRLVLEKKADFLGTDAHRTYHRPPSAERGLNWLYENVERGYAEAIAWGNAQKCLCV